MSPKTDWRAILEPLARDVSYEARLDSVLKVISVATGLESAYLYVLDESGLHFHLERSHGATRPASAIAVEGGAEAIEATPALELPATDDDRAPRVVATPVGRLYSFPLDGVGLVQVGPVSRGAPSRARRALADAAYPLGLVVRQAREEQGLRARLASLSARVDVGQRLAGSALDSRRYVALLLELALRATRTEGGFVAIVDERGALEIRAESGLPAGFSNAIDLDPQHGIFDWSFGAEGALILRDFEAASRLGVTSFLAVPLLEGGASRSVCSRWSTLATRARSTRATSSCSRRSRSRFGKCCTTTACSATSPRGTSKR